MYNIVINSLEEDLAAIGLDQVNTGRQRTLFEDVEDSEEDSENEELYLDESDDEDEDEGEIHENNVLSRVHDVLGELLVYATENELDESKESDEEDLDTLAESFDLLATVAENVAEGIAEIDDDDLLEADDSESMVQGLMHLAESCSEMAESVSDGEIDECDARDALLSNINAVLESVRLYESLLDELCEGCKAESEEDPFDDEDEDGEDYGDEEDGEDYEEEE